MKLLFKVFAATTIIMVTAFSFISCNQDNGYISQKVPIFNKNVFIVSGSLKEDTVYEKYNENISIFTVFVKKGKESIASINTNFGNTYIKDGNTVIGKIEYKNNEVYRISMTGWCTITKDESGKHKKAYIIKGEGNKNYPYTLQISIMGEDSPGPIIIK